GVGDAGAAERRPGRWNRPHDRPLLGDHAQSAARRERLQLVSDRRGRGPVRRDLRYHDPRARHPQCPRRRAPPGAPMALLLAEQGGVRMPGFFGYMAYSAAILIPLFVALTWMFLL